MAGRSQASRVAFVGVGVMALAGATVLIGQFAGGPSPEPVLPDIERTPTPARYPAAADTPEETVQALASGQSQLEIRLDDVQGQVQTDLSRLQATIESLQSEIEQTRTDWTGQQAAGAENLASLREEMRDTLDSMVGSLERRLGTGYPVTDPAGTPPSGGQRGADGLIWHAARGPEATVEASGFGLGTGLPDLKSTFGERVGSRRREEEFRPPIPVWTIPAEATLVRSRGLTALIGRIPTQGQVSDPLPFKVITGADNLLANGQVLPEVERAVWTGTAIGDRTLHCVAGTLQQVTFIFADGTIQTWPPDGTREDLGWISDERGYPCIPGRFVSNLEEVLGQLSASSFASGLTEAWAERQVTTTVEGPAITRTVTGDAGAFALARGAGRGIQEWSRIMAERAADTFDVVVVPPGQTLSIHVRQAIPIDWPTDGSGRRVRPASRLVSSRFPTGGLD